MRVVGTPSPPLDTLCRTLSAQCHAVTHGTAALVNACIPGWMLSPGGRKTKKKEKKRKKGKRKERPGETYKEKTVK